MQVYKITNKINNKIYIGITGHALYKRIATYKSMVKSKKPNKHRMVQAMKKHGFEHFIFDVLFTASSKEELKNKEIELISMLKSTDPTIGYNISPGGYLPSEESNLKRRLAFLGKPLSEEHKAKIATSLLGHKVSDKVRETSKENAKKICGWNRGTKGVMKANSGSFHKNKAAPNKGRKKFIIDGKVRYLKVEDNNVI